MWWLLGWWPCPGPAPGALRLSAPGRGLLVCVRVLEPAEGDPGLAWGVVG